MGRDLGLSPTSPTSGTEYQRWSAVYGGEEYYYGSEPGPVARRAVRYHRQYRPRGGLALDAGSGEGQDLAFLAERGYVATGVEFTPAGVAKAERLLCKRGLEAEILQEDLKVYTPPRRFDLVLAVNVMQFLGVDGDACLRKLVSAVTAGGVFGISVLARAQEDEAVDTGEDEGCGRLVTGFWLLSMRELLAYFPGWQMLEAARLWQWNPRTQQPQSFLTLIARNDPAPPPQLPLP